MDGIKAVADFNLEEVNLVTRKSPKSLGKDIDKEEVLFEGKASEAVKEFPLNINVAATISLACNQDINANPKTSMLAALSAIKLLKSFNESITVGL